VDDLNQLALMALAGAEQMAGQQGEGGGETAEQLEELAQQQGDLVDRTGQLTPLRLGEQALREQLEALAEEQQSVADELEELSRQEEAEQEALGDLSRLAAEAEAVAEALSRGRLTPETLERQERLFHRLLDAGRSLQKEEEDLSDERESRAPGAFERGDVVPLGSERLGALRYGLPSAEELQRLPPAVRHLVLQYFERLNRGGGGGGGR
jgi:predicted RNase H-like nuclease (RuvC/YqgF family)